jgi:hypothetical protein
LNLICVSSLSTIVKWKREKEEKHYFQVFLNLLSTRPRAKKNKSLNYFSVLCIKKFSLIFLVFVSRPGASMSASSLLAAASVVFEFRLLPYLSVT